MDIDAIQENLARAGRLQAIQAAQKSAFSGTRRPYDGDYLPLGNPGIGISQGGDIGVFFSQMPDFNHASVTPFTWRDLFLGSILISTRLKREVKTQARRK
jgi:hypothetical protein